MKIKFLQISVSIFLPLVNEKLSHILGGRGQPIVASLLEVAKDERIGKVVSTMLGENREMRRVCEKLGFSTKEELEDNMVWRIAELIGVSSRDRTVLRNQMARA